MWHKQLKTLMTVSESYELPDVESIKHLPDSEQADLIADKFAKVSNLYDVLDRNAINVPPFPAKRHSEIHWLRCHCDYWRLSYK